MNYRFALLLLLMAAPVLAETPQHPSPRSALSLTCLGCHSDSSSNASRGIPSLKVLSPEALASKLIAYQENRLTGTVMNRISQGLSLEEIQNLSHSFRAEPK
jgi:cytochrome c553